MFWYVAVLYDAVGSATGGHLACKKLDVGLLVMI